MGKTRNKEDGIRVVSLDPGSRPLLLNILTDGTPRMIQTWGRSHRRATENAGGNLYTSKQTNVAYEILYCESDFGEKARLLRASQYEEPSSAAIFNPWQLLNGGREPSKMGAKINHLVVSPLALVGIEAVIAGADFMGYSRRMGGGFYVSVASAPASLRSSSRPYHYRGLL
jgi:hypothetical protein